MSRLADRSLESCSLSIDSLSFHYYHTNILQIRYNMSMTNATLDSININPQLYLSKLRGTEKSPRS